MDPAEPIPQDKPVEVYVKWTCGDGCCSDSQVVHFEAGELKTIRDMCDALNDGRGWVLSAYRENEVRPDGFEDRRFPEAYHYTFEEEPYESQAD